MSETAAGYRTYLPPLTDAPPGAEGATRAPDRRDGAVYVLDDGLRLAVDVALATGRPLLLRGDPGSGKSSLAAFIARNLRWRYYEQVVTSRTRARDLLWTFDTVRKLADASAGGRSRGGDAQDVALVDHDYVEPGVLWWAMNRRSARRRGLPGEDPRPLRPADEPYAATNAARDEAHAVVLLDEIDKADPDVPNGLLVPLGSNEFLVTETGTLVRPPETGPTGDGRLLPRQLTFITTNDERELPAAFVRRCIVQQLVMPGRARLVEVAVRHVEQGGRDPTPADRRLFDELADRFLELRTAMTGSNVRLPSTAEYLDAVRACSDLRIGVQDPEWEAVRRLVLDKRESQPRSAP